MTVLKEPHHHNLKCSTRLKTGSIATTSIGRNAILLLICLITVIVASLEN